MEVGSELLKSDTCVYIYTGKGVVTMFTLYVDDLLLLGADAVLLEIFKKLMSRFKMADIENVSHVLGMQITHDPEKDILTVSQEDYTKSMLDRVGMSECKPLSMLGLGPDLSLEQPDVERMDEVGTMRYQVITGLVMYLTQVTHYDIMYATTQLARAMSKPSEARMAAAMYLFRYLAGTTGFSIVYKLEGFNSTALGDANWDNKIENSRPMSSYTIVVSSAPVSLKE